MIIRTPTRTKTKSFNGTQVDFKFPSTESLPRSEQKDEMELNNHHLLNVQLNSKTHLDVAGRSTSQVSSTHNDNDDNVSQILSDYTSASNTNSNGAYTNSSNGYYSFANISDNTTSPRFFADNKDGPVSSLNLMSPNKFGNYPMTLAPDKSTTSSPLLNGRRSNNSLRSSIVSKGKSSTGSQMASIPENKSVSAHTMNASIPTADNISYEIVSAISNIQQSQPRMVSTVSSSSSDSSGSEQTHTSKQINKTATVKKHPMGPTTNKIKPSKKITTMTTGPNLKPTRSISRKLSTSRRITSGSSSITPKRSRQSQLKRSNAIRCKGGLLAYFTSLGIKVKRTLKKLRIVIRKNVFFFSNGHGTVGHRTASTSNKSKSTTAGKKLHNGKHNANYSNSTRNGLTTSHLKRTDGYVTNLRRTISQSSRKSSLSKPITKLTPPGSMSASSNASTEKKISANRTTLRRTNSSIRRAASILTATPSNNRFSTVIDPLSSTPVTISNTLSDSPNPTHLTRSNGMSSLNSVIREPSIVVKNKVIPLSMNAYTIKEEDEYVIDTNSMYKRNSITGSDSDSDNNTSYFESNHEKSSIYSEDETDDSDYEIDDDKMTPDALVSLFNDYYRSIISKRIMMRLQMGQYNDSNNMKGEYMQLLEKFVGEYESDSSDIFDDNDCISSSGSTNSSTDDDSNSQFSFNTTDENASENIDIITPLEKPSKNDVKIQFESPFGMYSQNASLLSIPTDAVKRSLTLPIGINI